MKVRMYKMENDKRKMNKTITQIGRDIDMQMKEPSNILDMTLITIYSTNILNVNYIYIPDLKRYYFVEKINFLNGKLVQFICHVDVLMSFKNEIGEIETLILRQEKKNNDYITDNNLVCECKRDIVKKIIGSFGGDSVIILNTTGGAF